MDNLIARYRDVPPPALESGLTQLDCTQLEIPNDANCWENVIDGDDGDDDFADENVHPNDPRDGAAEEDKPCCPICSHEWKDREGIAEREAHVERCLSQIEGSSNNTSKPFTCPLCSTSFASLSAVESHASSCMGASESSSLKADDGDDLSKCPICVQPLPKGVSARIRHIKACSTKSNVRGPRDLEVQECDNLLDLLIREADILDNSSRTREVVQAIPMNHAGTTPVASRSSDKMPNSASTLLDFFGAGKTPQPSKVLPGSSGSRVKSNTPQSAKRVKSESRFDKPWQTCPVWKRIPDSGVVVDAFQYSNPSLSTIYLLSHFHFDHYIGLTRKFDAGIIYCSAITARLVVHCLKVPPSKIRILPMEQAVRLDDGTIVTALDANHAPGSCVFVFETKSGKTIVHTGDFRANDEIGRCVRQLTAMSGRSLDTLMLDTTYCSEEHDFMSQKDSIQLCKNAVHAHLEQFPKTLVVFGSYTIGKEKVALACLSGKYDKAKLAVTKAKLGIIRCYGLPLNELSQFTTNKALTNFWMIPMGQLNTSSLANILSQNASRFNHVLAVRPTGWVKTFKKTTNGPITQIFVPYSEHSSFGELKRFVRQTNARSIVPTVQVKGKSREQLLHLLGY